MNMAATTLRFVAAEAWPAVGRGFRDLTFEQSLCYGQAAAARIGAVARFVLIEQAGSPIAAAQVRVKPVPGLRRGIAWLPSGPLLHPIAGPGPDKRLVQDVLMALCQQFVTEDGHIMRFRLPGIACHDPAEIAGLASLSGFSPTFRVPGYRSIAIGLSQSHGQLMAQLHGKWRTDLRFAQKSGLALDHGTGPAFEARFMAMFETVQATKGFKTDIGPHFHFGLTGPDYALEILIATKDGRDVAGIVVGTAGQTANYLFGATSEAGRPVRAGYFLTWEGIRLAKERGLAWYDLGGVDPVGNPDVARFKERMGGVAIGAAAFEARPKGLFPVVLGGLETIRAGWKRRA